jgi:hypothetical protein
MEKPQLCIGVSGHRQLGDRSTLDFVREQFRALRLKVSPLGQHQLLRDLQDALKSGGSEK